ncbi:MAG: hypothetical protein H6683_10610, partial [Deltaproteobacteria bacterium]|nr:hypothetical protein [Deltaproteobacteria bacterium]
GDLLLDAITRALKAVDLPAEASLYEQAILERQRKREGDSDAIVKSIKALEAKREEMQKAVKPWPDIFEPIWN